MGRLLTLALTVTLAATSAFGAVFFSGPVSATGYSAYSTGYAFAAYTGAWSSSQMAPGQFAGHWYHAYWNPVTACCNDPSAWWPSGTWITNMNPAPWIVDGNGYSYQYTAFWLSDWGDPPCGAGNYWADVYFGRWKQPPQACDCNNATEYCYVSYDYVDNCQDAEGWGYTSVSYTGP